MPVAAGFWLLPSHAPHGTRGPLLGLGIPAPGPGLGMEPWPNKRPRGWGGLCPEGAGCHGVRWSPSGSPGVFPAASKRACVPPCPPRAAGLARFYWCWSSNKRCQLSPQTSSALFPPASLPTAPKARAAWLKVRLKYRKFSCRASGRLLASLLLGDGGARQEAAVPPCRLRGLNFGPSHRRGDLAPG